MASETPSKPSYHHGNLPQALQCAALALVSEGQLGSLSLRAVARRAGVSAAAPYRHFASREALLAAIASEGYRMRNRATRTAIAPLQGQPIEQFLEAGVQYVLFANDHPGYYAIMSAPEIATTHAHPELHEASAESSDILMESIRNCQAEGFMAHAEARDIAAAAWASVHGLAALISTGQLAALGFELNSPEVVARRVTRILVGNFLNADDR